MHVYPDLGINDGSTSNHGKIIQESLATLSEIRGLHRHRLEDFSDGVNDQCLQWFALNIFRNNQHRFVGFHNFFQQWQEVRQGGDLVTHKQHECVIKFGLLGINIGDEIRG